jgi:hypothetical protein
MGEHADDAINDMIEGSFWGRRRRPFRYRALRREQRTNQVVFADYEKPSKPEDEEF